MKQKQINYPEIKNNDIKVLGRVVSIASANKVAAAEQVFDEKFNYDLIGDYSWDNIIDATRSEAGMDQYTINRLFGKKLKKFDDAFQFGEDGWLSELKVRNLIADNATINNKLTTKDLEVTNNATIKNLHVTENSTFDRDVTIGGNLIVNNKNMGDLIEQILRVISGDDKTSEIWRVIQDHERRIKTLEDCCEDMHNNPTGGVSLSVNPDPIDITVGDPDVAFTVTPSIGLSGNYTAQIVNTSVATLVGGKVHAVAEGNTQLKIDWQGIQKTVQINVSPMPLQTFRVTFYPNNGQDSFHQDVQEGNKLVAVTDPVKDGYTFNGWHKDTENGTVWNFNDVVTSNMSLVAGYTQNEQPEEPTVYHTVTFHPYGDTTTTDSVADGNTVTKPVDPQQNYKRFEYWSTTQNAPYSEYNFSTPVTADLDLYGVWTDVHEYALVNNPRILNGRVGDSDFTITTLVKDGAEGGEFSNYAGDPITLSVNIDNENVIRRKGSQTTVTSPYEYSNLFEIVGEGTATITIGYNFFNGDKIREENIYDRQDRTFVTIISAEAPEPQYELALSLDGTTPMSAGQTISMDAHNGWGAGDTQSIYVLENPNKLESVQWAVTGGVEFIPDGNNPRQGVLKAIGGSAAGHVIVTGVDSGLTAECNITIANYQVTPYEFTVNPNTLSLTAGSDTGTVTGLVDGAAPTSGNVSFSSNNSSVATVSNAGVVTPVAQGTAIITASWDGHPDGQVRTALCTVTVAANPMDGYADGVVITTNGEKTATIKQGQTIPVETHKLKNGVINDSLAGDLTFELGNGCLRWGQASDDGVNYYDVNTSVVASAPGTARVTVTMRIPNGNTYTEYTDYITVTVERVYPETNEWNKEVLHVTADKNEVHVGDTVTLTLTSTTSDNSFANGFEGAYKYATDQIDGINGLGMSNGDIAYYLSYIGDTNGIAKTKHGQTIGNDVSSENCYVGLFVDDEDHGNPTNQTYGINSIPNSMTTQVVATAVGDVKLTFKSEYAKYPTSMVDGTTVEYTIHVTPNPPESVSLELDRVDDLNQTIYTKSNYDDVSYDNVPVEGYEYLNNYLATDLIHCPLDGWTFLRYNVNPSTASQAITISTDNTNIQAYEPYEEQYGYGENVIAVHNIGVSDGTMTHVTIASAEDPTKTATIAIYWSSTRYQDPNAEGLDIEFNPESVIKAKDNNFTVTATDISTNGQSVSSMRVAKKPSSIEIVDEGELNGQGVQTFTLKGTQGGSGYSIWIEATNSSGAKIRKMFSVEITDTGN